MFIFPSLVLHCHLLNEPRTVYADVDALKKAERKQTAVTNHSSTGEAAVETQQYGGQAAREMQYNSL